MNTHIRKNHQSICGLTKVGHKKLDYMECEIPIQTLRNNSLDILVAGLGSEVLHNCSSTLLNWKLQNLLYFDICHQLKMSTDTTLGKKVGPFDFQIFNGGCWYCIYVGTLKAVCFLHKNNDICSLFAIQSFLLVNVFESVSFLFQSVSCLAWWWFWLESCTAVGISWSAHTTCFTVALSHWSLAIQSTPLIFSTQVFTCWRSEVNPPAIRTPFLVMSAKLFGYCLTILSQTVRHWERVGLGFYFLTSSTNTRIICLLHFGEGLKPSVTAESISAGILFHGTSNTSAHFMSWGGTLLALLGVETTDVCKAIGELASEYEVDDSGNQGWVELESDESLWITWRSKITVSFS